MNSRAIVSREARYGLRAIRVGEASHPGPASRRRRTERLRALQRSMDSDGESDFDDDAMAGPTQVHSESGSRVAARRLVIVSQDVPVVPPEIHAMTDSAGSDGDQRQFDEKCAEILVGSVQVGDAASVGSRPCW